MSSFRKRNVQKPIPGTRTSPQTGQVITSSGNPSLDVILGGGLPIGSICLIEEDKFVTYSKVLAKYFLAEGVLSKQSIFLGSLDDDPSELLRKLPKPLDDEEIEKEKVEEEKNGEAPKNGLRIAWRYNDLPIVNSEQSTAKIGHHFNLMEQMDPLLLDYADTSVWNDMPHHGIDDGAYNDTDDGGEAAADETAIIGDHYGGAATVKQDNNVGVNIAVDDGDGDADNVFAQDVEMESVRYESSTGGDDEPAATPCTVLGTKDVDQSQQQPPLELMDTDNNTKSEECSKSHSGTTTTTTSTGTTTAMAQKLLVFQNEKFLRLLGEVHPLLREAKFTTGMLGGQKGLCRVCITSLGSPGWYDDNFGKDLLKFLTILRATVRSSVAVSFITMPMHLIAKLDESLVPRIRNLVDYAIELESFAGSGREANPVFKEYNGLLHLRKITAINTLGAYLPETFDLAFKLRRKKFVIEKLHLPPELQESDKSDGCRPQGTPSLSCSATGAGLGTGGGSGGNAKVSLDF